MKNIQFDKKRIFVVAGLVLLFFLMMDLNTRLNDLYRLTHERDSMRTEIANLTSTAVGLQTQIAYATSDLAVEEWAREEGKMVQPGDQLIVPISPSDATPMPVISVQATQDDLKNWQVWWALFFGE
jgi:cell division protein FtsB